MKFRFSALASCFLMIGILGSLARADVWVASRVWNEEFEARYSKWIESQFSESFFFSGRWGGLSTDCADAVYGSRIIFSYLNGLPFNLGPADLRFSQTSKRFDKYVDADLRVRMFVDFVNSRTWTGSLAKHTYPIEINRDTIVPGVIWMKPGHVETVRHVRDTGVVELRGSWLPGAVRKMITVTSLGSIPEKSGHGFRRWIWPQNFSRVLSAQPGFSDSQFVSPVGSAVTSGLENFERVSKFESFVQSKLQVKPELASARTRRMVHDYCSLLEARSQVVQLGYDHLKEVNRCFDEKEYEAYSTPSRDASLRRVVIGLGLLRENNLSSVRELLKTCKPVAISKTEKIDAFEFFRHMLKFEFSSNPHQKPAARFGLATEDETCVK